jgi:hypothetical protein
MIKKHPTLFLLALLISANPHLARANADEDTAYCLQIKEMALAAMQNYNPSAANPGLGAVKTFMLANTKNDIQGKKELLASHGLFSLETDSPSPQIAAPMGLALQDAATSVHDPYALCLKQCTVTYKVTTGMTKENTDNLRNCVQGCGTLMSDADKHLLRCSLPKF